MREHLKKIMGSNQEWESHLNNILRLADRRLSTFHPTSLLDVGCGDGSRTLMLARHFHISPAQTYGVEIDEPHVRQASEHFNASQIDLEKDPLPYDREKFDIVICNQVLEHLKNYQSVLEQIIAITRPGGYIIVGVPNLAHLINRLYLLCGIQPMCIALFSSHVRGFTHSAFEQQLRLLPNANYIDCEGSDLIYPLPRPVARILSHKFVGLCAYVCYLIQKQPNPAH